MSGAPFDPARRLTLEHAIGYIEPDELLRVSPKSIRLRKHVPNPAFRRRRAKKDA